MFSQLMLTLRQTRNQLLESADKDTRENRILVARTTLDNLECAIVRAEENVLKCLGERREA